MLGFAVVRLRSDRSNRVGIGRMDQVRKVDPENLVVQVMICQHQTAVTGGPGGSVDIAATQLVL